MFTRGNCGFYTLPMWIFLRVYLGKFSVLLYSSSRRYPLEARNKKGGWYECKPTPRKKALEEAAITWSMSCRPLSTEGARRREVGHKSLRVFVCSSCWQKKSLRRERGEGLLANRSRMERWRRVDATAIPCKRSFQEICLLLWQQLALGCQACR